MDSVEQKEARLAKLYKERGELMANISKEFQTGISSYSIPDRSPPDWSADKLKISLPFDFMEIDNIEAMLVKLKPLMVRYKEVRREQSDIMISAEIIKVEETVPE